MRTSLFILSLILAAAPAHAAPKIKKLKKVLVCGVSGAQLAEVKWKDDTVRVDVADSLDSAASELERQLESAGIAIVPFSEAEAAAKARFASKDQEAKAAVGSVGDTLEQAAGGAEDAGMDPAMAAALSNPAYTPEIREQIRKSMAGSKGQAGATMKSMAAAGSSKVKALSQGMHENKAATRGSRSTGHTLLLCPAPRVELYGEELAKFVGFVEELGADGWLNVDGTFGFESGGTSVGAGMRITTKSYVPAWVIEASVYDKKGKQIWAPRRQSVIGETIKIGSTAASAKKAIKADVPNIVGKFVKELTD